MADWNKITNIGIRVVGFLAAVAIIFCSIHGIIDKSEAKDWILFIATLVITFGFGAKVLQDKKNS